MEWELSRYISRVCRTAYLRTDAAPALVREKIKRRICNRIGRRRFFMEAKEVWGETWRHGLRVHFGVRPTVIKQWEAGIIPVPTTLVNEFHRDYIEHVKFMRSHQAVQKADSARVCVGTNA